MSTFTQVDDWGHPIHYDLRDEGGRKQLYAADPCGHGWHLVQPSDAVQILAKRVEALAATQSGAGR